MQLKTVTEAGVKVAVVVQAEQSIGDVQSALDLILSASYESGVNRIAIPKEAFCEDFFILSSGLAGEILQKFVNYQQKVAIYGDFSGYTSKPLKDFMYESNQGNAVFFVDDENEAVRRLSGV